jgi:cell division protein ZapA (FtsZ GTPase activity inhibitor)
MRSITVDIAGQSHTIRSDAEGGYVRALASVVDTRIRDVQKAANKGGRPASREAAAILVALQLADELEGEKRRRTSLRRRIRSETERLRALLDERAVS